MWGNRVELNAKGYFSRREGRCWERDIGNIKETMAKLQIFKEYFWVCLSFNMFKTKKQGEDLPYWNDYYCMDCAFFLPMTPFCHLIMWINDSQVLNLLVALLSSIETLCNWSLQKTTVVPFFHLPLQIYASLLSLVLFPMETKL